MTSNYPPGVSGNEYAIAGPDYEEGSDELCPFVRRWEEDGEPVELECGEPTVEQGYAGDRWLVCTAEESHTTDLPRQDDSDEDRMIDAAMEVADAKRERLETADW